MDISNKTLAMFLVAAIVVSIAGTTISLNKLESMETGPTGMVTSDSGNVSLSVGTTLSITLDNTDIQFGNCTTPASGIEEIHSWLDGGNQSSTTNAMCDGSGTYNLNNGVGIDIRNNGNTNANITLNATKYGGPANGTFLVSSSNNAYIGYNVSNATYEPSHYGGCMGNMQQNTQNITFSNYNTQMLVCDNLTNTADNNNSVSVGVTIGVPNDVESGDSLRFNILATTSV